MRSFPMSKLFDIGLAPRVLKHLTLKELVAFECVSHQWRAEVHFTLRRITQLAVSNEIYFEPDAIHFPSDFCFELGHHFANAHILRAKWTSSNLPQLIKKLPNLEAVFIGGMVRDIRGLFDALANCSRLVHVEIPKATGYQLCVLNISKITCIDAVRWYPTVRECPKLKYLKGSEWPPKNVMSNLVQHFHNGLLGVTNHELHLNTTTIIEHARHLRVLNISYNEVRKEDIETLVRHLKDLRTYHVQDVRAYITLLLAASNLDTLCWYTFIKTPFLYLMKFDLGHQLKKIKLESRFDGDLINGFAKFCPNLEELFLARLYVLEHLPPVLTHQNLRVLEVSLIANETDLQILFGRLPNLTTFRAPEILGLTSAKNPRRAANWIKDVVRDFPKIHCDIVVFR